MSSWPSPRARHGGVDEVPLPESRGRLSLCGKHYIGPDPEAALLETGATTVVCLNEAHELEDRYPDYVDWLRAHHPGRVVWFPVPDLSAPTVDLAVGCLTELRRRLDEGEHIVVHCGAGIGRAGTLAAALLVTMGAPLDDALRTVRTSRPMAGPEAGVQLDLVVDLARRSTG